MTESAIAIIGVGYVGLPLALALARQHPSVIAFDVDTVRIGDLQRGLDRNDPDGAVLDAPGSLTFSDDLKDLSAASAFIITVPTPIDEDRRPDLSPVRKACESVAKVISRGGLVIVESTVYPGVTEEVCGPLIAERSGLRQGIDFVLGYSPERINPGDRVNTIESVQKIISAQDDKTLDRVRAIYGPAIAAGLFEAPSIQVAEAAKVVENVQRDINIALMNELAMIFDKMNIRTSDVIDAAATKWNFQRFTPGLVGGHCIGVDPYYLISKAEGLGYYPELIRASRRLNNGIAEFVAGKTVDLLMQAGRPVGGARIGVLGLTFKEDVSDFRNSQAPQILHALGRFGAEVFAHDPHVDPSLLKAEYEIDMTPLENFRDLDALVIAVPHRHYLKEPVSMMGARLREPGVLVDVKSVLSPGDLPASLLYWSL